MMYQSQVIIIIIIIIIIVIIYHIFLAVYSSFHGFIWNPHIDQLPVGLLVERCTGITEVMSPNPVQA